MNTQPSVQRHLFEQFPILSQADIQTICEPFYPQLWHTIVEPWKELLEYRATDRNFCDFTEEETSQWLTIQSTHRARRFFDGIEGVRFLEPHRKLVIIIQEKLAITIKKLRKRMNRKTFREEIIRSNYLTRRTKKVWNQERGEESLDFPRIMLGYLFHKEITEISPVLAYSRTQRLAVEWALPIPKQGDLHSTIFTPRLAPVTDEQPTPGFSIAPIAPADRHGEEKGTGSE